MQEQKQILVTGVTGYIGGRLVPPLLGSNYSVRVLVRDPSRLQGRSWADRVEIFPGDVLKPETLSPAMNGVTAAYYLIHSMSGSDDFHQRDLIAASNFSNAAKLAGVNQIIYLGGLGDPETDLSEHLKSRQDTGRALAISGVPVTEFRAAVIVGSGSISFEMIRYLTERIPIMICPRWVFTRVQPISIRDVLDYLTATLEVPESIGKVIEIGGADVLTYGDMMMGYAEERGLKRKLISVPVLTPRLSSYWVHWMTPVPARITRPLIEGLRNEVIVRDTTAQKLFPKIQPVGYSASVKRALANLDLGEVETRWTDALVSSQGEQTPVVMKSQEGLIIERRMEQVFATQKKIFESFTRLGGEQGWLYSDWAWEILGIIDRLSGGVGLRRGRRDPVDVRVGDAIDFWRVEAVEPDEMMRLRAELKLPGKAWLQFEARALKNGDAKLIQTAFFAPKGLSGILFWYSLYPINSLIFSGLLRNLKLISENS
jgi:uncharacterized protein YbjT (DUF2867 family)